MTGNANLNVSSAVMVDSSQSSAVVATGNAQLLSPQLDITGGYQISGGNVSFEDAAGSPTQVSTGVTPQADPLRYLPAPDPAAMSTQSTSALHFSQGAHTLAPGVYIGGISVSGQASLSLQPGVYYLRGGGFSFSGKGSLVANGVMIYNAAESSSDGVRISGQGSILISPPTDGTYKGMALFQARTSDATIQLSGLSGAELSGTFYAAGSEVQITGNGDAQIGSQYISRTLTITGNGNLSVSWNSSLAPAGCPAN